jgi:hypothetical protein
MNALNLALAGLSLAEQVLAAQSQIHILLTRAQAEGRDVTDEEVAEFKATRTALVAKLNALLG